MSSDRPSLLRFNLIFSLLLAIIAVVFAVYNHGTTTVDLFFFQTEGSTSLVLIVTFALGVLVGLISSLPGRLRARRKLKQLRKERDQAQASASPVTSAKPPSGSDKNEGGDASSSLS